jgi:hypothetical protein
VGVAATSVTPVKGGAGGIGRNYSISGTPTYYAGGGGGGTATTNGTSPGGAGGLGGGGAGGGSNSTAGIAGTNGTGGGGGAGGFLGGTNYASGKGGSGIVIIRYPLPMRMTGTPLFGQLSAAAKSSAVGAFSLRAVNGGSAKAVQVRKGSQGTYPPIAMTSNSFTATGTYNGVTNAVYISSASTAVTGYEAWRAFQKTSNQLYSSGGTNYNSSTGVYEGAVTTTDLSSTIYRGEWLQIQLPIAIILSNYTVQARGDASGGNGTGEPKTWWILGSQNGSSWTLVDSRSGVTWSGLGSTNTFFPTSTQTYLYFRLVCNVTGSGAIGGPHTNLVIGELTLNQTDGPQDFYADRVGNLLTSPITGQPIASWLNGAIGYVTKWYDQSGKGNDAIQTTATNQPIISNGVLNFNGTSQYMEVPYNSTMNPSSYTVYTGCTSTGGVGTFRTVFSNRKINTTWNGITLYFGNNDSVDFRHGTGGSGSQFINPINPSITVTLNSKYQMTFRYDGTTLTGTVNGISSSTTGSYGINTSSAFRIGAGAPDDTPVQFYWNGSISDILYFSRDIGASDASKITSMLP